MPVRSAVWAFILATNGYESARIAVAPPKLAQVKLTPVPQAVNGEQYIAVAAGGNFQLGFPYGDVVAIFKLKK